MLQGSLTNIYRHSKSRRAEFQLRVTESEAILKVRDFGVGVRPHILRRFENQRTSGVGLAGMRGRISELGGDFQVESDSQGTAILTSIPFLFAARDEAPLESRSA